MAIPTDNNHSKGYFERLNYHYGQMMTERDFRDQQSYYNEKRWMMNRFGFGWGVMHGLKVQLNTAKHLSRQEDLTVDWPMIGISGGFALDKFGNEMLVPSDREYNLNYLLKNCKNCEEDESSKETLDIKKITKLYIAIKYSERGTEPFHVPETHCCDAEQECTFSRTREKFEFIASTTGWPDEDSGTVCDSYGCKIDNFRDLRNPKTRIINNHPQKIPCKPVPLATISYENDQWVVDNFTVRPIAYSTYRLGELIECLTSELWKVHAAGYDRRSFVPLLTQTIPGCKYQDGKTLLLENVGKDPLRITTDGRIVWCTDKELPVVHCISSQLTANEPAQYHLSLKSEKPGWGIAYDGHFVWVTVPQKNALEKINVCTRESSVITDKRFANPREIVFDGKYLWISHGLGNNGHDPGNHDHDHDNGHHNHNHDEHSEIPSWESEGKHPHTSDRGHHNNHSHQEQSEVPSWGSGGKEHHHNDDHHQKPEHHDSNHHNHPHISSWDSEDEHHHPQNDNGMNGEMLGRIIITRFNPSTGEIKQIVLTDEGKYSPINGMTFDGKSIWVTYNNINGNAIVQKVDERAIPYKEEHERQGPHGGSHHNGPGWNDEHESERIHGHINLRKQFGRDIAFDGNTIWVSHNEGLSKIDITRYEEAGNSPDRSRLSTIAFDGKTMWAVQNRGNETELRRHDLYTLGPCGGYELRGKHSDIHLGRFCFDGSYLWITGQKTIRTGNNHKNNEKTEDRTTENGNTIRKGVIYRVLP
jgi:hypothetical protein